MKDKNFNNIQQYIHVIMNTMKLQARELKSLEDSEFV